MAPPTLGDRDSPGAEDPVSPADVYFYSVQDERDRLRLAAGGEPWPTDPSRAFLGPGFYCWQAFREAEAYRLGLMLHGATDIRVIRFAVPAEGLAMFGTLDLTRYTDDEATA